MHNAPAAVVPSFQWLPACHLGHQVRLVVTVVVGVRIAFPLLQLLLIARLLQLLTQMQRLMAINELVTCAVAHARALLSLDLAVDGPVALSSRGADHL